MFSMPRATPTRPISSGRSARWCASSRIFRAAGFRGAARMEVTQAHLRPILREIGRPDAVSLCSLSGGSSPAWRVDLADGEQLVLKCYVDEQRWRNGKEAFASRLLAGLPIPITRYLVMDGSRQRLPLRFSLANYLPGATLHSLLGHPDIKSAFRQTGALLRQLHSVRLPAYGSFGSKGLVRP